MEFSFGVVPHTPTPIEDIPAEDVNQDDMSSF